MAGLGFGMVGLTGMELLAWWWWGPISVIPALAAVSVLVIACYLRLAGIHQRSVHLRECEFHQLQALLSIYNTLRITRPLPLMRGWAASPDFCAILIDEIMDRKPQLVIELGSGVSTLIIGYCLRMLGQGQVVSLDHQESFAAATRGNLRKHGLESWASVVHAPLASINISGRPHLWYDIREAGLGSAGPIDILVVDGPPCGLQEHARYPALPILRPYMEADAVLILDDFAKPEVSEVVERWQAEMEGLAVRSQQAEKGAVVVRLENSAQQSQP